MPSFFWLAYLRRHGDRSRAAARAYRPQLEHAADKGHPLARLILAKDMTLGRFGIRAVPRGLLLGFRKARGSADEERATERPLFPSASA